MNSYLHTLEAPSYAIILAPIRPCLWMKECILDLLNIHSYLKLWS